MSDSMNQQSQAWEYVGSLSAISGLVCFGLSSTYTRSFGEWGFGGLLAYLFVGLIMWCLVFRVKSIRVPERRRFGVSAAIFIVTCAISVLLDTYVAGKSDALSIISYGLFALMSLSVSRMSEPGFKTGFSTFFLSFFVEELLKISRRFLLPIALVFCLFIFILRRNNPERIVPDNEPNSPLLPVRQASPRIVDVPESRLPADNQQPNQEEPSQATHHSPRTEAIPRQESASDRGSGQNNEQVLAAESRDQVQIREMHPVSELRGRRRRGMATGIQNVPSRVGFTLGRLQRRVAPHFRLLFFFFLNEIQVGLEVPTFRDNG